MEKIIKLLSFLLLLATIPAHAATQTYYVDSDCGTPGNGTTATCNGDADDAYATLAAFDAARASDLVTAGDNVEVIVYGSAADGNVDFSTDWITAYPNNCLTVKTDSGQSESVHDGTFPSATYRISSTNFFAGIRVSTSCLIVDGLAIESTAASTNNAAIAANTGNDYLEVKNAILKGNSPTNSDTDHDGIDFSLQDSGATGIASNNIIYDWFRGIRISTTGSGQTYTLYGNTINTVADVAASMSAFGATDTLNFKNNVAENCTGNCFVVSSAFTSQTLATNVSEDGTLSSTTGTCTYTDDASNDFTLDSSDTTCKDNGTDLSGDSAYAVTTDIVGTTRSSFDIGAFEVPTVVTPPSTTINNFCGRTSTTDCPAPDADGDGYTTDGTGNGYDCDDTNWQVYPEVLVKDGSNWKECQDDGTFTTASAFPPTGGLAQYFINCDAVSNGDGEYNTPWNSMNMISYYVDGAPSGHHTPIPGDVFYIWGTCSDAYDPDSGASWEARHFLLLRSTAGTAANPIQLKVLPGETWTIDTTATYDNAGRGIDIRDTSDYIIVDGVNISGPTTHCAQIAGSDHVEWRNSVLHDCHGDFTSNNAGLQVSAGSESARIHHNKFYDNYDTDDQDSTSNTCISLYGGTDNNITYNLCYYTTAPQNPGFMGFRHKHGDSVLTSSTTGDWSYNYIWATYRATGTSTAGIDIHNNHIRESLFALDMLDHGTSDFHPVNNKFHHNTLVDTLLGFITFTGYDTLPSGNAIYNNVLYDTTETLTTQMLTWDQFGSNTTYDEVMSTSAIDFYENCYYTADTSVEWYIFNSDGFGDKGDVYTWSGWITADTTSPQNKPAFDDDSFLENPALDAYARATSDNCSDYGWLQIPGAGGGEEGGGGGAVSSGSGSGYRAQSYNNRPSTGRPQPRKN